MSGIHMNGWVRRTSQEAITPDWAGSEALTKAVGVKYGRKDKGQDGGTASAIYNGGDRKMVQ